METNDGWSSDGEEGDAVVHVSRAMRLEGVPQIAVQCPRGSESKQAPSKFDISKSDSFCREYAASCQDAGCDGVS